MHSCKNFYFKKLSLKHVRSLSIMYLKPVHLCFLVCCYVKSWYNRVVCKVLRENPFSLSPAPTVRRL